MLSKKTIAKVQRNREKNDAIFQAMMAKRESNEERLELMARLFDALFYSVDTGFFEEICRTIENAMDKKDATIQ